MISESPTTGQWQLPTKHQSEIIVCQKQAASTSFDLQAFLNRLQNQNSSVIYALPAIDLLPNIISTPQPRASFKLLAPLKFLGKGSQPNLDDTDLVLFDE